MPSNSIFGFLFFFVFVRKISDFAEFKVHLTHRKQVPRLHNIVLIFCDEGAGLVAVTSRLWNSLILQETRSVHDFMNR